MKLKFKKNHGKYGDCLTNDYGCMVCSEECVNVACANNDMKKSHKFDIMVIPLIKNKGVKMSSEIMRNKEQINCFN